MSKLKNHFLTAIVFGIVTGILCALMDLIPGNNIWTFSSFSGSLGFWAITGMIVVMLYDKAWRSAVGTFIYFAFMNATFFIVHFLISPLFAHPRVSTLSDALLGAAAWLIPSAVCGVCALIAHLAKRNDMKGIIALSLPIGLLVFEFISLLLSVIINRKYLFQTLVDAGGIVLLWKMYSSEKNKVRLVIASVVVAGLLLVFGFFTSGGTVLYY